VPPAGVVGGVDYCAMSVAAMDAATNSSAGACAGCASDTGAAAGCALSCAPCVNTLMDYLAACSPDAYFAQLNYDTLEAYAARLNTDCYQYVSAAARPFAAALCGAAFDHVVQFTQSAGALGVVLQSGAVTAPSSPTAAPAPWSARRTWTCWRRRATPPTPCVGRATASARMRAR
jgi:hypothetical protein